MKRVCNVCGLLTDKLVRCKASVGGLRPLCKDCKNKQQIEQRQSARAKAAKAARAELVARQAQIAEEEKAKSLPFVARARTFQGDRNWDGNLGTAYVRNDGHKHIPSVGVRC